MIVGSEISTERGEIIGLFLKEEIKSKDVQDVISEIKEQNGIIVIHIPSMNYDIPHFIPQMKMRSLLIASRDSIRDACFKNTIRKRLNLQ